MLTILLDGIAYGMLLFILACGLTVTLGVMNFVNLAHGAFAMLGAYVAVLLTREQHWPFLLTLPAAFVAAPALPQAAPRRAWTPFRGIPPAVMRGWAAIIRWPSSCRAMARR